jgi:hypothetical protein
LETAVSSTSGRGFESGRLTISSKFEAGCLLLLAVLLEVGLQKQTNKTLKKGTFKALFDT